ncbi:unnamed protein product [Adineta ricciae]|uniref:NAD(P)(+)--arginine ADP-ribosyltransferase n=1 Tax=Adineta ricciae TaxID=249248 RepID=A0A815FBU4_ADIRI|nr:unnamed protein product [Adineta ricciae]CAF1462487.1 unnamed protein product [Adineta ricciae]
MSGDQISSEDIMLICVEPVNIDSTFIDYFEQNGISVYNFEDIDECIEYILSFDPEDVFVFVWLGLGWNHLIPILHEFEHIDCVYLTEPTHYRFISKVHGVYTHPGELLQQLIRDIRICNQNSSTHLNMFYNQETSTIYNPQGTIVQSLWSELLLICLLRMPSPSADVYKDVIKEARFFYRNNAVQLAQIDAFEKNYRREDAIRWYSRNSFVYRLVNKALRTQNLVILFKFRTIIKDIYEQLTKLYHEQYFTGKTENKALSTITLHRAMKLSSAESNQLRSSKKGSIISINSFTSASTNPAVAIAYLGDDSERDVMLEIVIDRMSLKSDTLPFASIRSFSMFSDEEEVLLSMGTRLLIESVTTNDQYKNIYIKTRLCYEMDETMKELRTYILEKQLYHGMDESHYINQLFGLLVSTGDMKQLNQMRSVFDLSHQQSLKKTCELLIEAQSSILDLVYGDDFNLNLSKMLSNLLTSIYGLMRELDKSGTLQDLLALLFQWLTNISHTSESVDDLEAITRQMLKIVPLLEEAIKMYAMPPSHPAVASLRCLICTVESLQDNHMKAIGYFDRADASPSTSTVLNQIVQSPRMLANIAQSANVLGNRDCSEKIIADLHDRTNPTDEIIFTLAGHYEQIKDWSMAIINYRRIIDECNLPLNSISIIVAYNHIGSAFCELNDCESALHNFNQAHQLLLQHHPPTHPLLSQTQILISRTKLKQMLEQLPQLLS